MDFSKLFESTLSGGKRKLCSCPQPKAIDTDYQRIEMMVCNLPTLTLNPVDEMTVKEMKDCAKRFGLDTSTITEKEELANLIRYRVEADCAICLETMVGGAWIKQLPCGHLIHLSCAYHTFMEEGRSGKRTKPVKCPLCRNSILAVF